MAKHGGAYKSAKRRKELMRQKKQEEKRKKRFSKTADTQEDNVQEETAQEVSDMTESQPE